MALSWTLEMLKAGERINDLLYRSTVNGRRRPVVRHLAAAVACSAPDIPLWGDPSRTYGALDPSRG